MFNPYARVISLVAALALAWPYPLAAQRAERGSPMDHPLIITIGGKAFGATLSDNPTAAAFKALLPLSVSMSELNGNENSTGYRRVCPRSRRGRPRSRAEI